jgi:hypothetical protein
MLPHHDPDNKVIGVGESMSNNSGEILDDFFNSFPNAFGIGFRVADCTGADTAKY